jgi:hypothetical protein
MTTLAYARRAYKSCSRSARHLLQLIASHQSLDTGWAYIGYDTLADEASLSRVRVIQLVAQLETEHALDVRRGHGRGHTNFYRLLDETTRQPVPTRMIKQKVKSATPKKVKFPTPPPAEKVKSKIHNPIKSLGKCSGKIVETKERENKGAPLAPISLTHEAGADVPTTRAPTCAGYPGPQERKRYCDAHRQTHFYERS